jgi:hypothetical protein
MVATLKWQLTYNKLKNTFMETTQSKYGFNNFILTGSHGRKCRALVMKYVLSYFQGGGDNPLREKLQAQGFDPEVLATMLNNPEAKEKILKIQGSEQLLKEAEAKLLNESITGEAREALEQSVADLRETLNDINIDLVFSNPELFKSLLSKSSRNEIDNAELAKYELMAQMEEEILLEFFLCQGIDGENAKSNVENKITSKETEEIIAGIVNESENAFKKEHTAFFMNTLS